MLDFLGGSDSFFTWFFFVVYIGFVSISFIVILVVGEFVRGFFGRILVVVNGWILGII